MLSILSVVCFIYLQVVHGEKYSTGNEADVLCKAYKKVCPVNKICVVQNLYWPRKMSFPVCVHAREVPAKAKICELPPSPGGCGASFSRWYFNVHTKECSPLTYSGCEGNLNNFHTKEKCERVCEVDTQFKTKIAAPEIIRMGITSRTPEVLAAPAPLRLQSSNIRQALELKSDMEIEQSGGKKLYRKHRRGGRRNPNNKRRRRRRRHRKHRRYGSGSRRFAELRGRKTSFLFAPSPQNDQGSRFLLRQLRRKQRRLEKSREYSGYKGYYDNIKLFSLLGSKGKRVNDDSEE